MKTKTQGTKVGIKKKTNAFTHLTVKLLERK